MRIAVCLLILSLLPAVVAAESIPPLSTPYSAEFTQLAGDFEMTGKLWSDGTRQRMEAEMYGETMVTLALPDADTVYVFTEGESMALALDYSPELVGSNELFRAFNPNFQGRETLGSEAALRFAVHGEVEIGKVTGTAWFSPDGILLKSETETDMGAETIRGTIRLANIRRGPVDASLFELPAGMGIERR